MNKLLVLLGIVLVSLVTACGSSVLIEGGEQVTVGGSGGSGGNDVTTTTTTDPATGGAGGQEVPVELIVTYLGQTYDKMPLGETAHLFDFSLEAVSHELNVKAMIFLLASTDGAGFIVGSSGTDYFKHFALSVPKGDVIMGPVDPIVAEGSSLAYIQFAKVLKLHAGEPISLSLTARLSVSEDSSGEFVGREYFVSMPAFETGVVQDLETGQPLEPYQITPQGVLNGKPMQTVTN
jgi:cold shock CspA family protein